MDGALTPAVDGIRFSDWFEREGVSRTTAFALLKLARITPESRRVSGSARSVHFLNAAQEAVLQSLVDRMRTGASLGQLQAEAESAMVAVESRTVRDDPDPSPPLPLLTRLQAVDLAVATGAPVTTAEVRQLLGATPGSGAGVVVRGRVQARRMGRNCWALEPFGTIRAGRPGRSRTVRGLRNCVCSSDARSGHGGRGLVLARVFGPVHATVARLDTVSSLSTARNGKKSRFQVGIYA